MHSVPCGGLYKNTPRGILPYMSIPATLRRVSRPYLSYVQEGRIRVVLFGAGLLLALALVTGVLRSPADAAPTTAASSTPVPATYPDTATTSVPLAVVGVVSAAEEVTVRAQAAGTLHRVAVKEGTPVRAGTPLAYIDTPVTASERALAAARATGRALGADATHAARASAAQSSSVEAETTALEATQHAAYLERTADEEARGVVTALESAARTVGRALDFVDANRALFPSESVAQQRALAAVLYGEEPAYLGQNVRLGPAPRGDLLESLRTLSEESVPDSADTSALARKVDGALAGLHALYARAEENFFDEGQLSTVDPRYAAYLELRAHVAGAQQALQSSEAALRRADEGRALDATARNAARTRADLAYEGADTQAAYAARIAEQERVIQSAEQAVFGAQLSLARPVAPFAGYISHVFVKGGEYVTPGTPLYTLTGTGARELTVHVPVALVAHVRVGAPFVTDGDIAGSVARFAPSARAGTVPVVVELTEGAPVVGDVLRGTLLLATEDADFRAVPRSHVWFDSTGPYVRDTRGATARFEVMYDTGAYLYGSCTPACTEPLAPAISGTL